MRFVFIALALVSIAIYSSDLALVHDRRRVTLSAGSFATSTDRIETQLELRNARTARTIVREHGTWQLSVPAEGETVLRYDALAEY